MANEITLSMSLKCINGDFTYSRKISGQQYTQDTQGGNGGIQSIGFAAHEALALGDVAVEGWLLMRNVDDTNWVDFGLDVAAAFEPIGRMEPGEPASFRMSKDAGAVLYLKANVGAVNVEFEVLED